jgi:hypothetical protein
VHTKQEDVTEKGRGKWRILCWVAEYRTTANSDKLNILRLGLYCAYHYFREDTNYAVLFKEMVTVLNQNYMSHFRENRHFVFDGHYEGTHFLELECSRSPDTDLRR